MGVGVVTSVVWSHADLARNFVAGVAVGVEAFGDMSHYEMQWGGTPEGFIYFAAIGEPYITWAKIGFTKGDPNKRIAALQTGCPFKLKLLGYIFGNLPMEQEIHDVLKHERGIGEWFRYSEHTERVIADQLQAEYL